MTTAVESLKQLVIEKVRKILSLNNVTDEDIKEAHDLLSELTDIMSERRFNAIKKL